MSIETPETDAFALKIKTPCGEKYWVPVDIARKLERELAVVTEQRDELENKLKKSKSYKNVMKRDNAELRKQKDKAVNNYEAVTKERDEARGQRDRLAGALRIIAEGTSCRECGGEDEALRASEALQSLFCDALQSLTPKP